MKRASLLLGLVFLVCLAICSPVLAQEPTPEPSPTATPAYRYEVPLSSGGTLLVERRVTYGEMAVVIVLLVGIVLFLAYCFVRIPKLWR